MKLVHPVSNEPCRQLRISGDESEDLSHKHSVPVPVSHDPHFPEKIMDLGPVPVVLVPFRMKGSYNFV